MSKQHIKHVYFERINKPDMIDAFDNCVKALASFAGVMCAVDDLDYDDEEGVTGTLVLRFGREFDEDILLPEVEVLELTRHMNKRNAGSLGLPEYDYGDIDEDDEVEDDEVEDDEVEDDEVDPDELFDEDEEEEYVESEEPGRPGVPGSVTKLFAIFDEAEFIAGKEKEKAEAEKEKAASKEEREADKGEKESEAVTAEAIERLEKLLELLESATVSKKPGVVSPQDKARREWGPLFDLFK